ncbi:MAG: HNH endonuclease signature motif containing protein [Pseudomonadota bacterium]
MTVEPSVLRKLLKYDRNTGKLFWLKRLPEMFTDGRRAAEHQCADWNRRYAGKEAFTACNTDGYHHGKIMGKLYKAHRVIWALESGSWPSSCIDHKNKDRTDNRFDNLREATRAENSRNRSALAGSSSKYLGVSWCKMNEKWLARIEVNGRQLSLGSFLSEAQAAKAYDAAAVKHFGEFASVNL